MSWRTSRAESGVAPSVWAARHRALLAILAAQAAVLLAWMLVERTSLSHAAGHLTLIAGAAAIAICSGARRVRAAAMAIGLFSESMLAVHLAGGATAVHFHFFVMLCVLALYEDLIAFTVGAAYVVLHHGVMGSLVPHEVFGDDAEQLHPWVWALIHGGFVLGACLALVGNWRANRSVRASDAENRRRAEAYLEIADVMLVALDTDATVRMANRMVCQTLGRSEEELLGADWFDAAVPPDDRPAARRAFARLLADDPGQRRYEETLVRGADGATRLIEWHNALTRDDAGRAIGTLSSGLDITDRRAAEDALARQQHDLGGLRRLAQAVSGHDDARGAVVEISADLCDASFAALAEPAGGGEELVVTAATGAGVVGQRVRIGAEPSGMARAFTGAAPFFVAGAADHPGISRRMRELAGGASFLFQPVAIDGAPAAVLVLGWAERVDRIGARERELAALAADEAAVALQRLAALRRLEEAALVDELTGVANRRAFDAELPRAIARAQRSGRPLVLAMLDLNGFKAINDRDGHEAGDRLLKASAAAWSAELRATDLLARLGGDEFAVLLADCGEDDAQALAMRLRRAPALPRGCGVGVAVWDGAEDATALLRRADKALYADKARGAQGRLADPDRLRALDASRLVADERVDELDGLTRTAAFVLDVPVALVTLVDDQRQQFAGQHGLRGWAADDRGTPIAYSFCRHVVATGRPLVVKDARADPLVADNPAVDELDVLAYAGIPLVDDGGQPIGALCAIDDRPRDWRDDEVLLLHRLAERAIAELGS